MDDVTMSLSQLKGLMISVGTICAKQALVEAGLYKATLSKAQASKICGRPQLDRWIKEKLINPVRDSSGKATWRISRMELDCVMQSSNRHTFLNSQERRS